HFTMRKTLAHACQLYLFILGYLLLIAIPADKQAFAWFLLASGLALQFIAARWLVVTESPRLSAMDKNGAYACQLCLFVFGLLLWNTTYAEQHLAYFATGLGLTIDFIAINWFAMTK